MRITDKLPSIIQKITEHNPIYAEPDYGWVLMFHEVIDGEDQEKRNITISTNAFWNMVDTLGEKVIFCSIDEILQHRGIRQIYITFDDVCMSAFRNAMLELEKRQIPFCCFVSPGLVGKAGYIGEEEVRYLADSRSCTLYPHGMSHKPLRKQSYDIIKYEMIDSQKWVEMYCRQAPIEKKMFAYPYGSRYAVPHDAIICSEEVGYAYAFGTYKLPLNSRFVKKNPFNLPRINVNNTNCNRIIKRIVSHSTV